MWQAAMGGTDTFAAEELDIVRTEDRIHPTRAGYQDLAAMIWQWSANVR
jgi:lysophospholipase L1-like esterase